MVRVYTGIQARAIASSANCFWGEGQGDEGLRRIHEGTDRLISFVRRNQKEKEPFQPVLSLLSTEPRALSQDSAILWQFF